MEQREYIEALLSKSEDQQKKSSIIQAAYEKYYNSGSDMDFERLITELDSYCVSWVRKQLWKTGCYSDENEHNAMQESRLAAWKVIEDDKKSALLRPDFAYYAFGVYKHKVLDEIRKFSSNRKKVDVVSINEPIGDSGQTYEDRIAPVQFETQAERDEQRMLYEKLFLIYCRSFLESNTFPPRPLALYYARVLPHLLGEIPDNKAASAKWAFERMGTKTIGDLRFDSERFLSKSVDETLKWGKGFVEQLGDEIDAHGNFTSLEKVVYTLMYDKGKIEDWSDYMHKTCTKVSMNIILHDEELLEQAKEYISRGDVLYKFLGTGRGKN